MRVETNLAADPLREHNNLASVRTSGVRRSHQGAAAVAPENGMGIGKGMAHPSEQAASGEFPSSMPTISEPPKEVIQVFRMEADR